MYSGKPKTEENRDFPSLISNKSQLKMNNKQLDQKAISALDNIKDPELQDILIQMTFPLSN